MKFVLRTRHKDEGPNTAHSANNTLLPRPLLYLLGVFPDLSAFSANLLGSDAGAAQLRNKQARARHGLDNALVRTPKDRNGFLVPRAWCLG